MRRLAPVALSIGLLGAGPAVAMQLECPESLAVTQAAPNAGPEWTVDDLAPGGGRWLRAAGVSEGPPAELHVLKPDRIVGDPKTGRFTQEYRWSRTPQGRVHLVCWYHDTTLVLSRPLESNPQRCELEASVSGAGGKVFAVMRCDPAAAPR